MSNDTNKVDYKKPPQDFDWSKIYSLEEIFGQKLPINPDLVSKKVGIYFLLKAEFKEGNFCTTCLTNTPKTPRSHHKDCCNYKDADSYSYSKPTLGVCPECDSEDLSVSSCREMGLSFIECSDCCYRYTGSVCEEDLVVKFLKEK